MNLTSLKKEERLSFVMLFMMLAYTDFFGFTSHIFLYIFNVYYVYFAFKNKIKYNELFVKLILIGSCISIVSCYFNRKQSIMDSIAVYNTIFSIVSVFYFSYYGKYSSAIIKALNYFYIIFALCYFIQIIAFPTIIFPCTGINNDTDAGYKFFFAGLAIIPYGIFYNLNKCCNTRSRKAALLFSVGVILILLRVSRLQLFVLCLCVTFFVITYYNKSYRAGFLTLIFLLLCFLILMNSSLGDNVFSILIDKQSTDTFANDDYARNLSFQYFMDDFFLNKFEMVTGAGLPNILTQYGKYVGDETMHGIRSGWVDWGLLGYSWMFGITTGIGFLILWIKPVYKFHYNKEYLFCRFYFLFLIGISFFAVTAFMSGAVIIQCMIYAVAKNYCIENNDIII